MGRTKIAENKKKKGISLTLNKSTIKILDKAKGKNRSQKAEVAIIEVYGVPAEAVEQNGSGWLCKCAFPKYNGQICLQCKRPYSGNCA